MRIKYLMNYLIPSFDASPISKIIRSNESLRSQKPFKEVLLELKLLSKGNYSQFKNNRAQQTQKNSPYIYFFFCGVFLSCHFIFLLVIIQSFILFVSLQIGTIVFPYASFSTIPRAVYRAPRPMTSPS
jgi:hypothetical protein